LTEVVAVALSFVVTGSVPVNAMVATALAAPAAPALTPMLSAAGAPTANELMSHVTEVAVVVQVPPLNVALFTVAPVTGTVRCTPPVFGPRLRSVPV
jgi:hypothetical protein